MVALVSAVLIAALTLIPTTGETTSAICLVCGEYGGVDLILNILLFVPLGLGLRLAGLSTIRAVLIGFAVTLSIELLQTWIVAGRDASLGDLLANTIGAALGAVVASSRHVLLSPDARQARVLVATALLAVLGLFALGAWGWHPAPPDETYYAQWHPRLAQFGVFPGEVLDAKLDAEPFPRWRVESSRDLADAMRRGALRVAATVIPGAPAERLSPIVSVFDGERREVFILAQEGRDLVFRHRTRLRDVRLRSAGVRLEAVFPPAPAVGRADTMRVAATLEGRRVRLAAIGPDGAVHRVATLRPDLWWVAPLPVDVQLGAMASLFGALWMAAVALPIGYWSAVAGRWPAALLILGATAAVLAIVAVIGAPAPSPWSGVGALGGGAIGCAIGRKRGRRPAIIRRRR